MKAQAKDRGSQRLYMFHIYSRLILEIKIQTDGESLHLWVDEGVNLFPPIVEKVGSTPFC